MYLCGRSEGLLVCIILTVSLRRGVIEHSHVCTMLESSFARHILISLLALPKQRKGRKGSETESKRETGVDGLAFFCPLEAQALWPVKVAHWRTTVPESLNTAAPRSISNESSKVQCVLLRERRKRYAGKKQSKIKAK